MLSHDIPQTDHATVPVEIRSRWNASDILFRAEINVAIPLNVRIRAAIQFAVKQRANLSSANLGGANLGGADLRGANLGSANLGSADLDGANLRGANLRGANLSSADLDGANLRGANLSSANLSSANLGGADLRGANLGSANLGSADLDGANLRGANLSSANLGGADLRGANLRGAKIRLSNGTEIELASERVVMSLSPIGSENGTLLLYRSASGAVYAQRGCFGPAPINEFADAVDETHGASLHGEVYRAAIAMALAWAKEPSDEQEPA